MAPRVRRAVAVIVALANVWTLAVWLLDGLVLAIGPPRISSTDAARPLVVAIVAAVNYLALSGRRARARMHVIFATR